MLTELISVQKMPDYGYELRTEWWRVNEDDEPIKMVAAYASKGGHYIGTAKNAYFLCHQMSIRPEVYRDENNTCSIGFCKKEQKWYGWSHRAIYGFGVGDTIKEGDCAASSRYIEEYINEHPECDLSLPVGFTATTLDDARQMADSFCGLGIMSTTGYEHL